MTLSRQYTLSSASASIPTRNPTPRTKVTAEDVTLLIRRYLAGETVGALANVYADTGITKSGIKQILGGRAWRWLDGVPHSGLAQLRKVARERARVDVAKQREEACANAVRALADSLATCTRLGTSAGTFHGIRWTTALQAALLACIAAGCKQRTLARLCGVSDARISQLVAHGREERLEVAR